MIFKILPHKQKKHTLVFIALFIIFSTGVITLAGVITGNTVVGCCVAACYFSVLGPLMMFGAVSQYQHFEVYKDKIIVKNLFGKVNEVKLNEVRYVFKSNLPLYARDAGCEHYILLMVDL